MPTRGPRPEGTDGSDHMYRMIIENKYKRIAVLRKLGRVLFFCHIGLVSLLAFWYMVPTLYNAGYPLNGLIYVILEVMSIIAYQLAAFGTSKESMFFVKTYGILLATLTAEHMLIRWWYHVRYEKDLLFPQLLAKYIALATMQDTDRLRLALTVWEATLDASLFFVLVVASFCCKSYVQEKRMPEEVPQTAEDSERRLKND